MKDAILVINAGSSSVKFSVFTAENGTLELSCRGQLESLFTSPRFIAKDPSGKAISEKSWGDGVKLGHEGALDYLRTFLRGYASDLGGVNLLGVGHRVCHGGVDYMQPVQVNDEIA